MKICSLIIFILSALTIQAQPFYNIKDYGAIPDGKSLNSNHIQKAIDECSIDGGGTVVIPPGDFLSGTITLKENVSLFLAPGSRLIGSTDIKDYPGERKTFIRANNISGISITGKGTIEGNGHTYWREDGSYDERPSPFILFEDCENVTFRDIKINNSPSHTVRIERCEDFTFDGITILNPQKSPNTDGIDIVDSRIVTISNCYMNSGDDLICLKSHKRPVEYVTVTNCVLESDDAAIKFGTGGSVAIRYNTFDNIIIKGTRYGISFFMLTGGIYEHNRFSNITIKSGGRHKHLYPIFVDIDKRNAEYDYGKVENNVFENLKIITSGKLLITGHSEQAIEGMTLRDIDMTIVDEADFSKAKKPRGNRFYPKLETSVDLSRQKAHVVLGNINDLTIENFTINSEGSQREDFFTEKVQTKSE